MKLDLRASLIAGLAAAFVSLVVGMGLLHVLHNNSLVLPRLIATIALGPDALDPGKVSDNQALGLGVLVHLGLGVAFSLLISITLHRWGFWVGLIGGALFGLALYSINTYAMSHFFPEFQYFRSWFLLGFHVLFGALCGGIYEALERDNQRLFR